MGVHKASHINGQLERLRLPNTIAAHGNNKLNITTSNTKLN